MTVNSSRTRKIEQSPLASRITWILPNSSIFITALWLLSRAIHSSNDRMPHGNFFRNPNEIPSNQLLITDAIIVLGGGAPISLDDPPLYVKRRCDDAAEVIERHKREMALTNIRKMKTSNISSLPVLALSAGTAHVPQLMSENGLPIWESTSSVAYLHKKHGIDFNLLYVETTSYDTIGNAYYARTAHTDINGWRRLLIITNKFHMPRTQAIFDWIFGIDKAGYQLYYLESPDVGLSDDALQARLLKEAKSLETIKAFAKKYKTLREVWHFLNHQHDLYTASKLIERGEARQVVRASVEDLVRKSYGGKT